MLLFVRQCAGRGARRRARRDCGRGPRHDAGRGRGVLRRQSGCMRGTRLCRPWRDRQRGRQYHWRWQSG